MINSTQFHINAEHQVKQINHVVQTVKRNGFTPEVRNAILDLAKKAIDAITAMRREVYKQLEDFNYDYKYEHDFSVNESQKTALNVNDVRYLENEAKGMIIKIRHDNEYIAGIISHSFKKFQKTRAFEDNQEKLRKSLDDMIDAFLTIEHEVTEDDIKNNPDLEKIGIKVGDKIQIPAHELTSEENKSVPGDKKNFWGKINPFKK